MTLIIGDIIHLIGYYPMNRPTTTTTTHRPPSHDTNNKPYYQYPYNQNEWNYESNHIQHGSGSPLSSSYPNYNSPVSSTPQKPYNTYNYNNYGAFMDDTGYSVTPSAVVSGNRPQSTPSRPQNTNGYQHQDYPDDGYNYGSYQGIEI